MISKFFRVVVFLFPSTSGAVEEQKLREISLEYKEAGTLWFRGFWFC